MEIDWNSFQDRIRGYINPVVFIFVFIEMSFLVIVVAIILSVSRVPELNLEVEVSGIDRIEGIPDVIADKAEIALYNAMSVNFAYGQSIDASGAVVRDDTIIEKRFDSDNTDIDGTSIVSFIVDIPNVKQSYWMWYSWLDGYNGEEENDWMLESAVACPVGNESLYEDFVCRDWVEDPVRNQIVAEYLKYLHSEDFYAYVNPDDPEMQEIFIVVSGADSSQESEQKYVTEVKDYIDSIGVSSEIFNYIVKPAPMEELNESIDIEY